jgi:SSS family solute:Na+ symporter
MGAIDYAFLFIYLIFVIGIGAALKKRMKTTTDFFLSGRSIPAWICGLAFLSANLGAQEVIGMGASGAKYGIMTAHFYWIGAIPAMVFVGIFMMPFYYGSKARSVPEYLKLRFDEKTRAFNAFSFAIMTLFSSGISLFAMSKLLQLLLGWNQVESMVIAAGIVLAYILLGGLTSAIYNEVLQFFLIVFGFAPLVFLGLKDAGGWAGLQQRLQEASIQRGFAPGALTHSWLGLAGTSNPMGVDWFSLAMGLGFVLSFGYWCTDFLVVQRAMAADSMTSARRTPIIAAVPKMLFPFIVILPGMIAMGLTAHATSNGFALPKLPDGTYDYNNASPLMLAHYFPTGLLGVGMTALLASFMSGMAGNITAFNTVFTVDIYQAYIRPGKADHEYLTVGKVATIAGILLSVATAYLAANFNNIMDLLQLVFAFVNAPLFATFLLGMFWKRTTGHGAFWGLLTGTVAAAVHQGLTRPIGETNPIKGGWITDMMHQLPIHQYPSEMAQNFWTAIFAWTICFAATILISLATKRIKSDEDLNGLVYSLTPKAVDTETTWYKKPVVLGVVVLIAAAVLNFLFR